MDWANRRRIIYAATLAIILIAYVIYSFRDIFFPAPTCFDKAMNGYETGVDCGGTCSLKCNSEVVPLVTQWTTYIKTGTTTYDLVAMIANKNIDNAPYSIDYVFTVSDKNGRVLTRRNSSTIVPVNSDFPIIVQNVNLPPTSMTVSIDIPKANHYQTFEKADKPTIKVINSSFENGPISRVYVTIQNTKLDSVDNIPVRVVLYDVNQNTIGVGETKVDRILAEEQKNVVFTWNFQFKENPALIKVYPIVNPFVSHN